VHGWIEKTLKLAEPGSRARAKALIARVFWSEATEPEAAREANELAESLGDPELRAAAWQARSFAEFRVGRFDDSLAWAQRPFELERELRDPEMVSELQFTPVPAAIMLGRFREARRLAAAHDVSSQKLTPHHRVHGVSALAEVEELAGGWKALAALEERIEQLVAANADTPCIRNQRSLLLVALARARLGDLAGAEQIEARAEELAMQGYEFTLAGPRIALALVRGDLAAVERLVDVAPGVGGRRTLTWFALSRQAARLDALAALGTCDRIEREAPALARSRTYLEPFALRALGRVREDEQLLEQALDRFKKLGLDWHAEQTRALLAV
jgi:tetratricopeptide (TPR) repeat protein